MALAILAALALTALAKRPGRFWKALPLLALGAVVLELLPGNALVVEHEPPAPAGSTGSRPRRRGSSPPTRASGREHRSSPSATSGTSVTTAIPASRSSRGRPPRMLQSRSRRSGSSPGTSTTRSPRRVLATRGRPLRRRPRRRLPRWRGAARRSSTRATTTCSARFGDVRRLRGPRATASTFRRALCAEPPRSSRSSKGWCPRPSRSHSAFYASEPFNGGTGRWMGDDARARAAELRASRCASPSPGSRSRTR